MNYLFWTYVGYLAISVTVTAWVGQTLHKHGRLFLVECFLGNERIADAVNHMLLVGFYLVNIGLVALLTRHRAAVENGAEMLETLGTKVGLVLLVLGLMHFFNIVAFSLWRRRERLRRMPPPIDPDGYLDTGLPATI